MSGHGHDAPSADPIDRALLRARGILPDQGPIGVFIHHNTLHAFQHLPFHEGVQAGADSLGARPYLSLDEFRAALTSGRIRDGDVRIEIVRALTTRADDVILPGLTRAELWHVLMATESDTDDAAGLAFTISAGTARECAEFDRWQACLARAERGPACVFPDPRVVRRHRDVLVACGARDTDVAVHGELIRLSAGFLDQGQAHTAAPGRERGFLATVLSYFANGASAPHDCAGADVALRGLAAHPVSPRAMIQTALDALGVRGEATEPFLLATALALPGWTGMFSRLERQPEDHPEGLPVSLEEFLAVRLYFEWHAVQRACAEHALPHDWASLRIKLPPSVARPAALDAALLWGITHVAPIPVASIATINDAQLAALWGAVVDCHPLARRRVFQNAYERTYREMILDAVAARRVLKEDPTPVKPRAQFVFCIDEREESIRRAIEEQDAEYITFGMAGFFGVAIDYRGLYDLEAAAYCPVVVTPAHEVHENPVFTSLQRDGVTRRLRDRWLSIERRAQSASRSLTGGASMSFLLGPFSAVKTLARIAAPRRSLHMSDQVASRLAPPPTTRLSAIRIPDESIIPPGVKPVGFSVEESIDRVTAVLTNLGLVKDFAPIVIFLGHGSTSLNNPHESAHDCGACGGRRGGANARLFADMANRLDVREGVRQRGITIPTETWFVGALHDTADDSVRYYDLDALPQRAAPAFQEAYEVLERARRENARERARRFDNAPLTITAEDALIHVEERSAHLAQPRPEYGHCTNASCFVGRRIHTRGLHLDRRAFLVSYDPHVDNDHKVLERILAAVGPVGAGISLEYYFSAVDNETFGCGTKLPHNVTGLIGVMNGHQSDLRTGLPLQMVEIHEPMRLLLIVDATPEALLAVAGRQPEVAELVVNEWIQLVSVHPETGAIMVFDGGAFAPYEPHPTLLPVVERSPEWHMRSRQHLPPALVRAALPAVVVGDGHTGESARLSVSA